MLWLQDSDHTLVVAQPAECLKRDILAAVQHNSSRALLEDWGARLYDQVTSELWSSEGRSFHFNVGTSGCDQHSPLLKLLLCQVNLMVAMDDVTVTDLAAHTQHL